MTLLTRRRACLSGLLVMFLTASVLVAIATSPAHAAFPGIDGLIVFQSNGTDPNGRFEIWTMNAGGGQLTQLTNGDYSSETPSWSADGSKIVYLRHQDTASYIAVMNADGSGQTDLTPDAPAGPNPTFSPDGSKIAWAAYTPATNDYDIWVMDSDGSDAVQLESLPGGDLNPVFSPDGTKILFQHEVPNSGGNLEIYVMGADGSNPTNLTNTVGYEEGPDWSPDGSRIVFTRPGGLSTMKADGTDVVPVPGTAFGDKMPSWSPDGSSLIFTNYDRNFNDEVYRTRIDGVGGVVRLTANGAGTQPEDWFPDWQPTAGPPNPYGEFTSLTPSRIVDTRIGTGGKLGKLGPAQQFDVQIDGQGGVPAAGVGAVVLNATVTEPTVASYLTIWPAGVARPTPSNLNYVPGQTVPNLVTVAVGADGKVSVYNNAGSTHVIFDVVGFYSSPEGPLGSRFRAVTPFRLFDTRTGFGPLSAGYTFKQKVTGTGSVPASGVTSVVLNVTLTEPNSSGFITVYPDDVSRPVASNLNFVPGLTAPNLVVVRVPANGVIDFYHYANFGGSTFLLADLVGYFDGDKSTEAGRLVTGTPFRVTDTRLSSPAPPPGCIPGGASYILTFTNPVVGAVIFNTTVTQPTASGHLIVYPWPPPAPLASNLNFVPGQTVPNLVMAKLGTGGQVGFLNSAGCTHLVIDVFGAFTSAAAPSPSTSSVAASDAENPYGDVTASIE